MSLPSRVGSLLTNPSHEWAVIAKESREISSIYLTYVVPLAAIPAVAVLLGIALAGGLAIGQLALATAITAALTSYTFALALPFAAAVVIEHLAPRFKSDASTVQAFKLVAYASTPLWLAGVCYFFVELSRLAIVGAVYGVYLFYAGLSPVLETPIEQRVPFTLVAVIAILVIQTIFGTAATLLRIPYYGF